MSFADFISTSTISAVRARIIGYAQDAGLAITSWVPGDVAEQMLELVAQVAFATDQAATRAIRGFASLDTSTDPGDVDDFDPGNASLPAEAGFLSALGAGTYYTTRASETFANGFVSFVNNGSVARTFGPDGLVFTWTVSPPTPAPTYRNAADDTIYTNPDGTVTVGVGVTVILPIVAEDAGKGSNAPSGAISLTTSLLGCTATNAVAVLGAERESRDVYIARCRQAPSRGSFAGARDKYDYLSAKNIDGTPLLNVSGTPVAITRTQKSESSTTGIVNLYFASDSGPPLAEDVDAANENITVEVIAVPGCITYAGVAAIEVMIHVVGTARIKAAPGISAALAKDAIVTALGDYAETIPIGGHDQVSGAGVVYTTDLRSVAAGAYPGLYDVLVSLPATSTTALAVGRVATIQSDVSDWTVTVVS